MKSTKCVVIVHIAHKVPNCSRLGVVGCNKEADQLNDDLIGLKKGIPNMPRNNDEPVGPSKGNGNKDPKKDGKNGNFPAGVKGFEQFLEAAWKAALLEGKKLCEDKCCKDRSVIVKTLCSRDAIEDVLLPNKLDKKWLQKEKL